ncbi:Holliday junction resolvase [Candidatus Woesearchaeota archaeon]|nr:Holliday junction resolvase [Candidatus Woesearchaeota archaeon]
MIVSHAGRKGKGSAAERELIHLFWAEGWAAFRAAGSGSSVHPCPDIIAGNSRRKLAIEVKIVNAKNKYFPRKEILDLVGFANAFGAEPWVAVKFPVIGWCFIIPDDLKDTGNGYSINTKFAELRSLKFTDIVGL